MRWFSSVLTFEGEKLPAKHWKICKIENSAFYESTDYLPTSAGSDCWKYKSFVTEKDARNSYIFFKTE